MKDGFTKFVTVGLFAALIGALSLGENMLTLLLAVAIIAGGDVIGALWAAGPDERRNNPEKWVTCGLAAATGTCLAFILSAVPSLPIAFLSTTSRDFESDMQLLTFAFGAGFTWLAHWLAWRSRTIGSKAL